MAKKKNPAAVALGSKGAKAGWAKLTPREASKKGKKLAAARWKSKS